MSDLDVARDARPAPADLIDANVKVPESVRKAAERANAFYQQPAPDATATVTSTEPAPQPAPASAAPAPQPAPEPAPQPAPQAPQPVVAAPQPAPPQPAIQPVTEDQWQHRYHSMEGRYKQSQRDVGMLQEQVTQLGNELIRTQELLRQYLPNPQNPQNQPVSSYVTPEDVENYGEDLINVAKRAAADAVAPQLTELHQQNQRLENRLAQEQRNSTYTVLDAQVPTWRDVNRNPRFLQWLSLRDVYSGQVRKVMLNDAFKAADAPRVVSFFKGFISDEQVAGQQQPAPQMQQQAPTPAPRQPAVPLEQLAAPGRARPATGDTSVPADKPVFTRQEISQFYRDVVRGAYVGREQQKAVLEAQMIAATKEGRVR